jgi:hypothetical protein
MFSASKAIPHGSSNAELRNVIAGTGIPEVSNCFFVTIATVALPRLATQRIAPMIKGQLTG